ncbi:hypothetical protein K1719_018750 [Acacia pycnantha]|nr:hypothetical protein K1719_018750 [Acacia pycnantha]
MPSKKDQRIVQRAFSFLAYGGLSKEIHKLALEVAFKSKQRANTSDQEDKEQEKPKDGNSSSNSLINKPPLVEEIAIPSVSVLLDSGVRFLPTNKGISSINFDAQT